MKFAYIGHKYGLVSKVAKWTSKSDCIEAWSYLLDADHFLGTEGDLKTWKRLNQYDVILINQNTSLYELTWLVKKNCPSPFLVAIADGCVRDMAKFNSKTLNNMIRAARACDLYGTLVDWSVPNYKLITHKPVRWIGVPFFAEFFSSHRVNIIEKNKTRLTIGLQNSLCNTRNGLLSLLVAKSVNPARILLPCRDPGWEKTIELLDIQGVEFYLYADWPEFIKRYRNAHFCVHLDTLYTFGRFPLDMAAMGIPVIGSNRNETNKILWPDLTIDPVKDIEKAKGLAKRLTEDKDFYTAQVEAGMNNLAWYSPQITRRRLLEAIKEIENNK